MGRRWKVWYSVGTAGCAICGSKDKGDLASPGLGSFGNLWCAPCLVVGGKYDPSPSDLRVYERLGYLDDSREAFRRLGLRVAY